MSVEPAPRLGRAVRFLAPVVLTACLAVPMLVTADASGHALVDPSGPQEQPAAGPEGEGALQEEVVAEGTDAAEGAEGVEVEEFPLYTIDSRTPEGAMTATPPDPCARIARLRHDRRAARAGAGRARGGKALRYGGRVTKAGKPGKSTRRFATCGAGR